jgi:hypothetical protein
VTEIDLNREIAEIRQQYTAILDRVAKLGTRLPGGMELVAETCHGGQFCHGGSSKTLTPEDLAATRVTAAPASRK